MTSRIDVRPLGKLIDAAAPKEAPPPPDKWADLQLRLLQAGIYQSDARRAVEVVKEWAKEDAARALIREFVDHYAGNAQAQLGNGFAYKWCDKARAALGDSSC